MDFDEKRKRQLVRVVVAEVFMVLAVIAIVVISTLAAMGFMISSNGGIEQSGLMQLHTLPTGASVEIDGGTLFARTNLSRTLSAGDHSIKISKDNYDTWQKTIQMRSGVLLRIYYPRLFLQNRVAEVVKDLGQSVSGLEFYVPSVKRNYILYAEKGASQWQLLDLRGDEVKVTPLDLSGVLPGMVEDRKSTKTSGKIETHSYKFVGKIMDIRWMKSEEKVLVKVEYEGKIEWVLVSLRDVERSLNITKSFGLSNEVEIGVTDDSGDRLYALEKHQLRRINTSEGVVSRVLLDNVISFSNRGSSVAYVSGGADGKNRSIGVYRDDERGGTKLADLADGEKVFVVLSSYYGEDYVAWSTDKTITTLFGKIPSYSEDGADLSTLKKLNDDDVILAEEPSDLGVSPDGEYVVARRDKKFMVVDLESGELHEYDAPLSDLNWFDASMMYAVVNGEILVWDFDGTNRRNLAESLEKAEDKDLVKVASYPVMVTNNNRWLYYLTNDSDKVALVRERIRD